MARAAAGLIPVANDPKQTRNRRGTDQFATPTSERLTADESHKSDIKSEDYSFVDRGAVIPLRPTVARGRVQS